jgi:glyoxylase-like metal-dependent hydrolase (beta-lactamase superfamily II)
VDAPLDPHSQDAAEAPGHPEIVRIRAPNPGPMTLTGTNTYVVGSQPAWVIDPGPAIAGHIEEVRAVAEARGGIAGVLITHGHLDHNEGVEMLGAPVLAGSAEGVDEIEAMLGAQETAGGERVPERVGPFEVIPTPGHAVDHLVFVFGEVVFNGDLVLGEGSSIVPPAAGGGSLADYMRSLELLDRLGAALLAPGHGPWITDPPAKIAQYAEHRRERERLLIAALDRGERSTEALLDAAWGDVPEPMRPAAALAMRAHLEKLWDEDRAPRELRP